MKQVSHAKARTTTKNRNIQTRSGVPKRRKATVKGRHDQRRVLSEPSPNIREVRSARQRETLPFVPSPKEFVASLAITIIVGLVIFALFWLVITRTML